MLQLALDSVNCLNYFCRPIVALQSGLISYSGGMFGHMLGIWLTRIRNAVINFSAVSDDSWTGPWNLNLAKTGFALELT